MKKQAGLVSEHVTGRAVDEKTSNASARRLAEWIPILPLQKDVEGAPGS